MKNTVIDEVKNQTGNLFKLFFYYRNYDKI
jgi:hypothetical protein